MSTATRTYEIVPFRPEHYLALTETIEAERGLPGLSAGAAEHAETLFSRGVGQTGFVDGQVIAAAGLLIVWPGLATAWALLSPRGRDHPVFVHRAVVRGLRRYIETLRLRRVEANVVDVFNVGHDWIQRLGFREESRMPQYGPNGETFVKYVRFP